MRNERDLFSPEIALPVGIIGLIFMTCSTIIDPLGVLDGLNCEENTPCGQYPTPTPIHKDINSFENSFNSDLQLTPTPQQ